jgi:hypothetical protein
MDEPIEVSIEYLPEWVDDEALVTPLGAGLYRQELDPMPKIWMAFPNGRIRRYPRAAERKRIPYHGDVFEAVEIGPQALRFVRVVERARLRKFTSMVSTQVSATRLKEVRDTVTVLGGHWEQVFGGFLTVYLPEGCRYDPVEALYEGLGPGEPRVARPPGHAV